MPKVFRYRTGDITANICGRLAPGTSAVRWRLNERRWNMVGQGGTRMPYPAFCVEIRPEELVVGINHVTFEAISGRGNLQTITREFCYDPSPVRLPHLVNWENEADLDVEGGTWETIRNEQGVWVRPRLGFEDYDRIVLASGAFAGGRRVTTQMTFRHRVAVNQPFGFGVLPLWGGRPDLPYQAPRDGWNFGLAWYYSHYNAVGSEFSYRFGDKPPRWVSTYRNIELHSDATYNIVVEAVEVVDLQGRHLRYRQRMQWTQVADRPSGWIELGDDEGAQIPGGEYAVALIAHRCQVEFGPVLVEALPSEVASGFQSSAQVTQIQPA